MSIYQKLACGGVISDEELTEELAKVKSCLTYLETRPEYELAVRQLRRDLDSLVSLSRVRAEK